MSDSILKVLIDERANLHDIDDKALRQQANRHVRFSSSHCQVFKDYILSSEVFYVDSDL